MDLLSLLVSLLVLLVVGCLVYWAVHRIEAAFGMPGPIVAVVDVILVIVRRHCAPGLLERERPAGPPRAHLTQRSGSVTGEVTP